MIGDRVRILAQTDCPPLSWGLVGSLVDDPWTEAQGYLMNIDHPVTVRFDEPVIVDGIKHVGIVVDRSEIEPLEST